MTKINLKEQAVKGAKVTFRCGGVAVIEDVRPYGVDMINRSITFVGCKNPSNYYSDGSFYNDHATPFDIISIEPPAFDWSTVKRGMAFEDEKGFICWYVGECFEDKKMIVIALSDKDAMPIVRKLKSKLKPSPEHDHPCVKENKDG